MSASLLDVLTGVLARSDRTVAKASDSRARVDDLESKAQSNEDALAAENAARISADATHTSRLDDNDAVDVAQGARLDALEAAVGPDFDDVFAGSHKYLRVGACAYADNENFVSGVSAFRCGPDGLANADGLNIRVELGVEFDASAFHSVQLGTNAGTHVADMGCMVGNDAFLIAYDATIMAAIDVGLSTVTLVAGSTAYVDIGVSNAAYVVIPANSTGNWPLEFRFTMATEWTTGGSTLSSAEEDVITLTIHNTSGGELAVRHALLADGAKVRAEFLRNGALLSYSELSG